MHEDALRNDPELQRVARACLDYWLTEPLPPEEREVFYRWVRRSYERRFGTTFHQSRLQRLADLGVLCPTDTSRGGSRRYYAIVDPDRLAELLAGWGLPAQAGAFSAARTRPASMDTGNGFWRNSARGAPPPPTT